MSCLNRRNCLKTLFAVFLGFACLHLNAATWYVRPDGGTRYSPNVKTGQCDGTVDTPYPGQGVNRHCAFKDVRMLWQDGSYADDNSRFPTWGWIGRGGDTYIIRGSIASGVSYRVGWPRQTNCNTADGLSCWGLSGDAGSSGAPPPPTGTPQAHTRIYGGNFANCTAPSARTQLHGGWGVGAVMTVVGSSYVDIACLDLTDFANCGQAHNTMDCKPNGTIAADFASNGITIGNKSTHISLKDVRIHGMGKAGILGAPGDGFEADDLALIGNAESGWNADDGSHTTGVGSFIVRNYDISWNGCVEEYPIVNKLPYGDCTDQDHGGYGDGFGTASMDSDPPGWQVTFDSGTVSFNTQDGLDALHIGGKGSSMTVSHTRAFSNMGQQIKVGGATATITDSLIVGNCRAMSETIPGTPAGYNNNLDLFCRAGDTAVLINVPDSKPAVYKRNIMYSNNKVGLEIEYPGDPSPKAAINYDENIFIGFKNRDGEYPDPIYSNTDLKMFTNPGSSFDHNTTYRAKRGWECPAKSLHETDGNCGDPHLKDETWHPYGFGDAAGTFRGADKQSDDHTSCRRISPTSFVAFGSLGVTIVAGGVWCGMKCIRGRIS